MQLPLAQHLAAEHPAGMVFVTAMAGDIHLAVAPPEQFPAGRVGGRQRTTHGDIHGLTPRQAADEALERQPFCVPITDRIRPADCEPFLPAALDLAVPGNRSCQRVSPPRGALIS